MTVSIARREKRQRLPRTLYNNKPAKYRQTIITCGKQMKKNSSPQWGIIATSIVIVSNDKAVFFNPNIP